MIMQMTRYAANRMTLILSRVLILGIFAGSAANAQEKSGSVVVLLRGIDIAGTNMVRGVDGGATYIEPGKDIAAATVEFLKAGRYSVYARVYFTWDKSEHVFIKIGDEKFTAGFDDLPSNYSRWDEGNIQVWHWVKAGEISAAAGAKLEVEISGPGRLDRIVFHSGGAAWREPWLAGAEWLAAGPAMKAASGGDVILEGGAWGLRGAGQMKRLPDTTAALLSRDGDAALRRFSLSEEGEFEIWARLFFYGKNIFDGRTMEEWQHAAYLSVDGCLVRTIPEQTRRRWTWHRIGRMKIGAGEHLLAVSHRGAPILVENVVLMRGDLPVDQRDWYARKLGAVLPFGIEGVVDPLMARRAGQWLLLGELGSVAEGRWLGENVEGKRDPVEVKLPAAPGRLVMELNHPLELSPAATPQYVGLHSVGDLGGIKISFVLLDREGMAWMLPGRAATPDADGWTWLYAAIEPSPATPGAGVNLYPRGDSGRHPEQVVDPAGTLMPRQGTVIEQQPMGAQWGDVELTHIVIESPGQTMRTLRMGHPEFIAPLSLSVEAKHDGDWARAVVSISNHANRTMEIPLYVRVSPVGGNVGFAELHRGWKRHVLSIPGGRAQATDIMLELPDGGVHEVQCRLGAGAIRHARFLSDRAAKPVMDVYLAQLMEECAAFEDAAWKRNASLADVQRRHGSDFRITVDGMDVTSLEYAELHQSVKPFKVAGVDLSDSAGWPDIHVPPGTVAYDPRHGRLKFSTGYDGPMKVVGSYHTGFGVPHCAPFFIGDYVVTPGGKGNYSVFDAARKDRPEALAMLNSWYFSSDGYVLGDYVYFNSSKRGVKLVDDMSNPTRPGVIRSVDLDVARWGGLSGVDQRAQLLFCSGENGLALFDAVTDPARPSFVALVEDARFVGETSRQGFYFVKTETGLAVVNATNPATPVKMHEWSVPDMDAKDWAGTGVLAMDGDRLLLRAPHVEVDMGGRNETRSSVFVVEFDEKIGFFGASPVNTDLPASSNFSGAFYKDCIYLLDGGNHGSQSSVSADGYRSLWHVYRLNKGEWERVGEPIKEDSYPAIYHHIRIRDDIAYVADYNIGLRAFDLADPANPRQVARYIGAAEGDALYANDGMAYFWQTFGGQVYILDCAQPSKPALKSIYWDGAWVSYQNVFRGANTIWGSDSVFYSPRQGKGLAIIDAADPSAPRDIGTLELSPNLRARGELLATRSATKDDKSNIRLYDIKDPRAPKLLGETLANAGSALFWRGDHVFLAQDKWLSVLDVSNPANPIVVSETDLSVALAEWKDADAAGIAAGRDTLYVTARRSAKKENALLVIIDIRNPSAPIPLRVYRSFLDYLPAECNESWANFYQCLDIRDDRLFIGSYGRIECYDISEPILPKLVDQIEVGFQWGLGMLDGDYLYVPGLAEFQLLRVPASPQYPKGKPAVE